MVDCQADLPAGSLDSAQRRRAGLTIGAVSAGLPEQLVKPAQKFVSRSGQDCANRRGLLQGAAVLSVSAITALELWF